MYDMIIRAGRLGNGQLVDVAIKHGKIAALGSLPESTEAKQTLTLGGQVHVSAGWIDGHTHVSIHRNSIDTGKMRRSSLDPTFLLA